MCVWEGGGYEPVCVCVDLSVLYTRARARYICRMACKECAECVFFVCVCISVCVLSRTCTVAEI